MNSYSPLWQRGVRGDFVNIFFKSPFIPLCQRGIKTSINKELESPGTFFDFFFNIDRMSSERRWLE
jgi:hypothetical protein